MNREEAPVIPKPASVHDSRESGAGRWMALWAALLGWMFDGLEMGLFPLIGRPALRELLAAEIAGGDADRAIGTWFGACLAAFLVGASLGGVLFGWLGDRVGRVRAMVWSVLVYSVFSGLGAVSQEPWHLAATRFLAALGMGGEWALGVALVMEIWPSRKRPLLAGLIGASANVGFLLVGLIALGLPGFIGTVAGGLEAVLPAAWVDALRAHGAWRLLCVVGAAPALLCFFIRLAVPESEKWRHAARAAPPARVADIFRPGTARLTWLGAGLAAVVLLGTWGSVQWVPAWTGRMTGARGDAVAWAQIALAVGAIGGSFGVALLAERFNRRLVYAALCVLALASCQVLFRAGLPFGVPFLVLAGLAGGLSAGFYGWLPLYLPEIMPTRVRATGAGFCFNIGRILAAGGTLLSGTLVAAFGGDYARMCAVISLVYVSGLLLIRSSPETKGRPLPD